MKKKLFSIFMCARNAECTIGKAINSVLEQTYANWELLIVDNGSKDGTWNIIEGVMNTDSRVKGIRLEQGIGWAKGASLCLEKAEGRYMTFLAADDFLLGNGALDAVEKCIKKEQPDIVWVGHINAEVDQEEYFIGAGVIPKYKIYNGTDKVNEIYDVMESVYYNAFFHFISIELLKNNGIDFYEPFYADYEGVTEAMCRSRKSVVLDQAVYVLVRNTSQSIGTATWKYNTAQWSSIKRAVCEVGYYSFNKIRRISRRIMDNNVAMLKGICSAKIQNKEMNLIHKTSFERLQYVENILETPEFDEMFYYSGREHYLDEIFKSIKGLFAQCIREGCFQEGAIAQMDWLDKLVLGLCEYNGEELVEKVMLDIESIKQVKQALCNQYNIGMFGYELVGRKSLNFSPEVQNVWNEINNEYISCIVRRIYELLHLASEIKRSGRIQEMVEIAKECMGILDQIKSCMSGEALLQVANELKAVTEL